MKATRLALNNLLTTAQVLDLIEMKKKGEVLPDLSDAPSARTADPDEITLSSCINRGSSVALASILATPPKASSSSVVGSAVPGGTDIDGDSDFGIGADPVHRRCLGINLSDIVNALNAHSQKRRRLSETADKLSSCTDAPSKEAAKTYKKRCSLATTAEKISKRKEVLLMEADELDEGIADLTNAGTLFLLHAQENLVARGAYNEANLFLTDDSHYIDHVVPMMDIIVGWKDEQDIQPTDAVDESAFDASAPKNSQTCGSETQQASLFEELLVDHVCIPLLNVAEIRSLSPDNVLARWRLLEEALASQPADISDAAQAILESWLDTARSMVHSYDVMDISFKDEFWEFQSRKAVDFEKTRPAYARFLTSCKSSEHLHTELRELRKVRLTYEDFPKQAYIKRWPV